MNDESLRAALESCYDKGAPLDVWCEICRRWEGANDLHADWCPVPAFTLAVARLEAAGRDKTRLQEQMEKQREALQAWHSEVSRAINDERLHFKLERDGMRMALALFYQDKTLMDALDQPEAGEK